MLKNKSFTALAFLTNIFICLFFIVPQQIIAQTPTPTPYPTPAPKSNTASVSATMPDIVPPSTPILISPTNGELVNTNLLQFVWQESTDNVGVTYYQFYLDGSLEQDSLITTGTFPNYTLAYNSTLGYYYLDLGYVIGQGAHTWKIAAVDAAENSSNSATWTFTVDSIAPTFVITNIGSEEVSISSQDADTVPSNVIELDANEPELVGTGEANSSVDLTVEIPDEDDLNIEFDIASDGTWSYTLPILSRGKTITLNFIITDLAGHISVLEDVKIIIPSQEIVIPQTSVTPTAGTSATPQPTPTIAVDEYGEPIAQITPEPTEKPKKPITITIPIKPPKEIVHDVVQFLAPTPILKLARRPWFKQVLDFIGPWIVFFLLFWPAVVATFLVAKEFGFFVSGKQLIKIWQTLGIIPHENREGWVFNSQFIHWADNKFAEQTTSFFEAGIDFAQVIAISQNEQNDYLPIYKTVLTDYRGLYLPLNLPANKYRVSVQAEEFRYPSSVQKPDDLALIDFYQAQEQELSLNRSNLSLQIPVDKVDTENQTKPWWQRVLRWLAKLILYKNLVVLLNLIIGVSVYLFWPSIFNLVCIGIFILLGLYYLSKDKLFGNVQGLIIDKKGNPVPHCFVRLIADDGSRQTFATLTNNKGRFNFCFKTGDYQVKAVRPGLKHTLQTIEAESVQVEHLWQQKHMVLMVSE